MTESTATDTTGDDQNDEPKHKHLEQYAGHISSYHGKVHWWLAIVYLILFVWGMYYGFVYWGGLGPGLDY